MPVTAHGLLDAFVGAPRPSRTRHPQRPVQASRRRLHGSMVPLTAAIVGYRVRRVRVLCVRRDRSACSARRAIPTTAMFLIMPMPVRYPRPPPETRCPTTFCGPGREAPSSTRRTTSEHASLRQAGLTRSMRHRAALMVSRSQPDRSARRRQPDRLRPRRGGGLSSACPARAVRDGPNVTSRRCRRQGRTRRRLLRPSRRSRPSSSPSAARRSARRRRRTIQT
jgi:hypothetical protein